MHFTLLFLLLTTALSGPLTLLAVPEEARIIWSAITMAVGGIRKHHLDYLAQVTKAGYLKHQKSNATQKLMRTQTPNHVMRKIPVKVNYLRLLDILGKSKVFKEERQAAVQVLYTAYSSGTIDLAKLAEGVKLLNDKERKAFVAYLLSRKAQDKLIADAVRLKLPIIFTMKTKVNVN